MSYKNLTRADPATQEAEYVGTVEEWCRDAKVSIGSYFKAKRAGEGPHIGQMGRRTPVIESPAAYYRRMAGLL